MLMIVFLFQILAVGVEVEQLEPGKKVLFSDINAYELTIPQIFYMLSSTGMPDVLCTSRLFYVVVMNL
ncbi:hypothetical protein RHMOL_Rhmol04G0240000 [Rhododendron molle]|uniref:Uncharacterized protein n=1 Tax=Rhododendron molle TaxID=49168 RepID=A0ACC0P517_RHOML|nr:hypothetical protein RHMOL_Rhmol04G0240000 [Rhododendron molle]